MFFLRKKSRLSLLFIFTCSFCISLLTALIHAVLAISTVAAILGLTTFFSGIFLYLRNQYIAKNQLRLVPVNHVQVIPNNQTIVETKVERTVNTTINTSGSPYNENIEGNFIGRDSIETTIETTIRRKVDTGGGIYNESIAGDLIGRDSVTKNIKNITVGNREVEINPNDIFETFDEFRDILAQSIAQSSNALEAISEFVKELTEELRNHPEVKVCFGVDENISVQELVKKIFLDLLTKTYDQINEINQSHQITRINQPDQVQKINIANGSEFIEYFEYRGNNEYNLYYKKYHIHLFQEKLKRWLYRIKRSDSSIFVEHSKHSRNIYFAIGRAIDQIDNEIDLKWKNSINNPE